MLLLQTLRKRAFICLLLSIVLIAGCGTKPANKGGVNFKSESLLSDLGFLVSQNKEVSFGNEKVEFIKVVFDVDSFTFAYKADPKLKLEGSEIQLLTEKEGNVAVAANNTTYVPPVSTISGADYQLITIPHHLKLVRQKVTVKITKNGVSSEFDLMFPGDKIAKATTTDMFDAKGNKVTDPVLSDIRIRVGINYTLVEGSRDVTVLDAQNKKLLKENSQITGGSKSDVVLEPISIPRLNVDVKYIADDNILIISQRVHNVVK